MDAQKYQNREPISQIIYDLKSHMNESDENRNGIAWDADRERIFVTGKFWPKLFEIKTVAL